MLANFGALVRKDLILELRSGRLFLELVTLSLLILVVLLIAYGPSGSRHGAFAAAAVWVAMVFSALPASRLALAAEGDNDCIKGLILSPVDPATVYAAKTSVVALSMTAGAMITLALSILLFNLELSMRLARLIPVLLLGTVGLAALGTLLGTMTMRLELGDVMLALLGTPLYVPALIAGISASIDLLNGASLWACGPPLKVLLAWDLLFGTCGCLLYEYLVS